MRINNVNIEKVNAFVEEVKEDKTKALKTKKIEGKWNFEPGKPQFQAELQHKEGTTLVEVDAPPPLGGSGLKPDPVQYCLFGLAACFSQTFASIAAEKGVNLTGLKVIAENEVNLAKALGLGNEPIVEKVKLSLEVVSEATKDQLQEIKTLAMERCPGVYCLTNPIKLEVEL